MRRLLTAGKVGDIAHYVLDGEYVHSDGCLDVFLNEQYSYEQYGRSEPDEPVQDYQREGIWEQLVELGAWTVTSAKAIDPEYDTPMTTCAVCGYGIVLVPVKDRQTKERV